MPPVPPFCDSLHCRNRRRSESLCDYYYLMRCMGGRSQEGSHPSRSGRGERNVDPEEGHVLYGCQVSVFIGKRWRHDRRVEGIDGRTWMLERWQEDVHPTGHDRKITWTSEEYNNSEITWCQCSNQCWAMGVLKGGSSSSVPSKPTQERCLL